MEMMMFVLVSAVAMLISPCAANPLHHNLKHIIDLVQQYNKTLTESFFVEDVTHLADAGCGDNLICKVHDILEKHAKTEKRLKENDIVINLKGFISHTNMNCKEVLKTAPETKTEKPLLDLLENLKNCIQKRIFNGNTSIKPLQ